MIVGFTGTRKGMSTKQKTEVHDFLQSNKDKITACLHGGCIGADEEFHNICLDLGLNIEVYYGHPSNFPLDLSMRADLKGDFKTYPSEPFLNRNRKIVSKSGRLLATPHNDSGKGGTWYTIHYARNCHKTVVKFDRL